MGNASATVVGIVQLFEQVERLVGVGKRDRKEGRVVFLSFSFVLKVRRIERHVADVVVRFEGRSTCVPVPLPRPIPQTVA